MQDYNNMDIKQLAAELNKLDDENLCLIIKSIETAKLKELLPLLAVEKGFRVIQETKSRGELNKVTVDADNIPIQLQLALTADDVAPTPNLLLRSNLFAASKTHGAINESVRDFEINTYGEKARILLTAFRQFTQLDLDLLLELIKLQQKNSSFVIKVSAYELAKNTKGYGDGKQTYLQIKEQIEVLTAAKIKIINGRFEFFGGILNNAYFDNEEQLYIIEFNHHLQPLFSNNNWTGIDTNIRKQLKSNLAKWLHGFYSSHLNSNLPIGLDTIYKLSGATDKDRAQWIRISLTKALDNLQLIFAKNGKRFVYKIEGGNLYVNKTQTVSQNKSVKSKILSDTKSKQKKKQPELM